MSGAAPQGARNQREAALWVRAMFGRVARRYDLANHLLSFNVDRFWRARTARRVRHVLEQPGARVLDICCGTGDLLLALARAAGESRGAVVFGSDFCHPMLAIACRKSQRTGAAAAFFEADALCLPLRDGSFDLVTVAFGFRNLADYQGGLAEMRRLLRPGGVAAILEFSQPPNRLFRSLYNLYSRRLLPLIGGALSGSRDAYSYLPESVRRFPSAAELAGQMRGAGFHEVRFEYFTGGIVALHLGRA